MSLLDDINDILEKSDGIVVSEYINGSNKRRSGRTTRLVWYYINEYFNTKEEENILITDHYNNFYSNDLLVKQIIRRLQGLTIQKNIDYDILVINLNIFIKKRKTNFSEQTLSRANNIIAQALDDFFNKGIIRLEYFKEESNNWQDISYKRVFNLIQYSLLYEIRLPYNYLKLNYKNKTVQNLIFK